jgi:hypothetical protein
MYINPNKKVKIIEWITSEKKVIHYIDNIYQDDKINEAIKKIYNFFNTTDIYIWDIDNKNSIEFKTNIDQPTINPFLYKKKEKKIAPSNIEFIYSLDIFLFEEINLIKLINLPKNLDKNFYFNNKINKNYNFNKDLLDLSLNNNCKISSISIINYNLIGNIKLNKSIKYIYENIDTDKILKENNEELDCIVWIYDTLNKQYNLVKDWYVKNIAILDIENNIYNSECLLILNRIDNKSYYQIKIENSGNIIISFNLQLKYKYNFEYINNKLIEIKNLINKITDNNDEIIFKENNIKCQIILNKSNFSINKFNKNIDLYKDIIEKIKSKQNEYIYLRTITNNIVIDDTTYIKNLLNQGFNKEEIKNKLKEYLKNKTDEDLENIIDNIGIYENNEDNTIDIIKLNYKKELSVFKLNYNPNSGSNNIVFDIDYISTSLELKYMIYWLSKLCNISVILKPKKDDNKEIIEEKDSITVKRIETKTKTKSSSSEDLDLIDNSLSSNDSLSGGGTSQIAILKSLDSKLFMDGYARSCLKDRQPMGMTKERFNDYKHEVDNNVEINNNIYFCPRWWCPEDDTPLKYKNKGCKNGEEPINLYSKSPTLGLRDPNEKHLVLIKKDKKTNIDKPCCHVNKDKNITNNTLSNNQTDYILTNNDIVQPNRFATLPKEILYFLNQDANCKDNLLKKKTLCVFRKGIEINKDKRDIIDVICYLYNLTRKDFINKILNEIDFNKYIMLENGEIIKEFLKLSNNIKNKYKIKDHFYNKNIDINNDLKNNIWYSFIGYIKYLKSNKINNPHYLYSIISIVFKDILYVWNFKNNQSHLLCPFYSSYIDLENLVNKNNKSIICVYNNNGIYEPIIMKSQNLEINIFNINNDNKLSTFNNLCNNIENNKTLELLKSYISFISSNKLHNYKIKSILLNSNITISTLLLTNDLFLILNSNLKTSILSKLIEIVNCDNISLYDKYLLNNFNNTIKIDTKLNERLQDSNFKIVNSLTQNYFEDAILFYNTKTLYNENNLNKLILKIAKYIYENYNNNNNNNKWIKNIKDVNQLKIIKILFEEINNYKDIDKWYNSFNFNKIFMSKIIEENKFGRLIFSNKIFKDKNKIPNKLLPTKYITNYYKYNEANNINNNSINNTIIFKDIDMFLGEFYDLPKKWNKFNKYNIKFINSYNYNNDSLYKLFQKLLILTNSSNKLEDIKLYRQHFIKLYLNTEKNIEIFLGIINYKKTICNILNKSDKTNNKIIIDNILNNENKEQLINNIIDNIDTGHPDIYAASELINISFIIIRHRAQYSSLDEIQRGDIKDYYNTCDIYINKNYLNEPLVILYCDDLRYYLINIYNNINNIPYIYNDLINLKINNNNV